MSTWGRALGKKYLSNRQTWFWECDGMRIHGRVRSGKSSFFSKASWTTRLFKLSPRTYKSHCWKLWIKENFAFHHGNDPERSSHLVRGWCLYNWPKVIKTPTQSPDLNVFENLWAKLGTEIRNHSVYNKEVLKKALREEWERISPEYTNQPVESILDRLKEVTVNRGLQTW